MSIDNRLQRYRDMLPDWTIGEVIGHGSGGKTSVYRIRRDNLGFVEEDVLKVINIIEEDLGLDEMSDDFRDSYLKREEVAVKKALDEVKLMRTLDNCNNIVTYQWFSFVNVRDDNCTATDLLIRMHEYSDLNSIIKRKSLSQKEIVGIGIDICIALEGCLKNRVIHRDIKPDNIFYDQNKFLLGDFGISKILEDGAIAQTNKGTPPYAAPEQFDTGNSDGYDNRVDIYSLGLTLYTLANKGQLPFFDRTHSINAALMQRLMGNPIPPVEGICNEFNDIILKACAFKSKDRYQNPTDMKDDLINLMRSIKKNGNDNCVGRITTVTSQDTAFALGTGEAMSMSTEPALGAPVASTSYATEPALGAPGAVTSYATEPALGAPVAVTSYATEPALGAPVAVTSYATEPALGAPVAVTSYATEPALGAPVAEIRNRSVTGSAMEPHLTNPVASANSESHWAKECAYAEREKQESTIKEDRESYEVPQPEVAIDYLEKAVGLMKNGNLEKAFEAFATLAEKEGYGVMYNEITKYFSDSRIISSKVNEAIYWFEKCVSCCSDSWTISLAEYQLGEIYSQGLGVKTNHKIAEKYYSSSAAKGNMYAKRKFVAGRYVK